MPRFTKISSNECILKNNYQIIIIFTSRIHIPPKSSLTKPSPHQFNHLKPTIPKPVQISLIPQQISEPRTQARIPRHRQKSPPTRGGGSRAIKGAHRPELKPGPYRSPRGGCERARLASRRLIISDISCGVSLARAAKLISAPERNADGLGAEVAKDRAPESASRGSRAFRNFRSREGDAGRLFPLMRDKSPMKSAGLWLGSIAASQPLRALCGDKMQACRSRGLGRGVGFLFWVGLGDGLTGERRFSRRARSWF